MSWEQTTIGDLVKLQRGHDLTEAQRKPGSVPVVGSAGINGYHSEIKQKGPSFTVGRSGASIGKVTFIAEDYWPHNTCLYAKDLKGNNARFLAYFLSMQNLAQLNSGAAQPSLNRNFVHTQKVLAPTLPIQERIVSILSSYDDLIENNRKRIALLEKSARLLYREWFIRFHFPGHETAKYVEGLPEGWSQPSIDQCMINHDRKRVPLSVMEREKRQGNYPYHGAAGVLDYVDEYLFDGRYLLMGEDGTVVTKSGAPMLQFVEGRFWVSNHAHVLEGLSVSTEYLWCALSNYQIAGHITGVAQPKITQKNMNRIPITKGDKNTMDMFDGQIKSICDQIFVLKKSVKELIKARDLLLPRLMDGRIEV